MQTPRLLMLILGFVGALALALAATEYTEMVLCPNTRVPGARDLQRFAVAVVYVRAPAGIQG